MLTWSGYYPHASFMRVVEYRGCSIQVRCQLYTWIPYHLSGTSSLDSRSSLLQVFVIICFCFEYESDSEHTRKLITYVKHGSWESKPPAQATKSRYTSQIWSFRRLQRHTWQWVAKNIEKMSEGHWLAKTFGKSKKAKKQNRRDYGRKGQSWGRAIVSPTLLFLRFFVFFAFLEGFC